MRLDEIIVAASGDFSEKRAKCEVCSEILWSEAALSVAL